MTQEIDIAALRKAAQEAHDSNRAEAYAALYATANPAAILALLDRLERAERRFQPPNEIFAIVRDRHYEGEGLSLAVWNGDNYSFSDGDCYERDGDTLDGWTAEWLTDHQLEKRLEQAEKAYRELDRATNVPKVEKGSQNWAGMSGAVAHHLIERHAENWADVDMMMAEWADARCAAMQGERA